MGGRAFAAIAAAGTAFMISFLLVPSRGEPSVRYWVFQRRREKERHFRVLSSI